MKDLPLPLRILFGELVIAIVILSVALLVDGAGVNGSSGDIVPLPSSDKTIAERVHVKFRQNADVEAFRIRHRLSADAIGSRTNEGVHYVLVPAGQTPSAFSGLIAADVAVQEAREVFLRHGNGEMVNDPRFPAQWGPRRIGVEAAWKRDELRDSVTSMRRVLIGILDTGVDTGHPDLRTRIDTGRSFVDARAPSDVRDEHGHGTHVAGIAGATIDNDAGIAGVSWSARMIPVRVLDPTHNVSTENSVELGIDHVRTLAEGSKRATVGNMGLGHSRVDI